MLRSVFLIFSSFFSGVLFVLLVSGWPASMGLRYPLKVSLYNFKIDTTRLDVYREWVRWHHDAYRPMVATLDRERMYFESVFRDSAAAPDIIYWLAIDGEGGASSNTSPLDIDKKHVEYMKQILIKGSRSTLQTEFSLLPDFIQDAIGRHQQASK